MPTYFTELGDYLKRIGYAGKCEPDLATLQALHQHHVQAIPFENLSVLLGYRISMDPAAIAEKIIRQKRGGYCFEQNTLFREVLRLIGYEVTPLLARVRWNVPPEVETPLTHMVLRVEVAGQSWLADVGFGAIGTPSPLCLDMTVEQATTHEPRRIVRTAHNCIHQVRIGDGWQDVYQFALTPPAPIDFELGNWYSCTHPKALFVNNLIVTRVTPEGRVSIYNREFTWRDRQGKASISTIRSMGELHDLLREKFGLNLSEENNLTIPSAPW